MQINNQQFSDEELTILQEAMDAWVSKDFAGEIMGDIFASVLLGKDATEEDKMRVENDRKIKSEERAKATVARKRQATLIKAKLIQAQTDVFGSCKGIK
jgi:hypothetical protein